MTWARCPDCRRPLVPIYVEDGQTVMVPMPYVRVFSAKLTCPVDGKVIYWKSSVRELAAN
jgi:uncharacterized protein with PIN domain